MFRVYHSNQLDLLKSLIASLIEREPLADPFAQEVILVQSHGMAQWLQIELAEHFGIAANIEFPLPASFIWQMFTKVLANIPQDSAFSKDAMTWKVMHLLPTMLDLPEFAPLNHYLSDDSDKRKHYQLSSRIADIFDHYLVYRPEWLQAWEQQQTVAGLESAQQWQAPLWRALKAYTQQLGQPEWHRANLYQRFIQTLDRADSCPPGLPKRIFICGISALPPVYLQALQALGRHIDIHLMFTNPCRYYWGDIQDYGFLARLQGRRWHKLDGDSARPLFRQPEQADSLFDDSGVQQLSNPLLASWGKLGRDNLYLLAQLDNMQEVDAFVDIEPDNLLHRLQSDILALDDFALVGDRPETLLTSDAKRPLDPDDRSVSLHACHSAQREVEVLHDKLLALLDAEPDLNPRDIIVMVADIDNYTPYIQAVFGNAPADRYLPFAISDRRAREAHPVIQALLSLLELPKSRFGAEDVLSLLDVPALALHFAIDESGLRILRDWVADSGIRWGLDDETLSDLQLPITGQNTWRFGLSRMLLGYAMNSDSGEWQGILPFDESSGLIAELVGRLADLLAQLAHWRGRLQQLQTLPEWLPLCSELLSAFFVLDEETEPVIALIEQQWQQLISMGMQSQYAEAFPVTVLRDELAQRLDNERISQRFLAGPVNFCTLMPMRSIPFKVVCLLGMNDGVYPRTIQPLGFDLMAQRPQRGDRSRRDDDRYLFLEAMLSAQQQLYISYIGHSIQDNSPRYPSVLVSELLDYIAQSHVLPGDEICDVDISANAVRQHIVTYHSRVPFSEHNFTPDNPDKSYAREWLPAARREGQPGGEFNISLPETSLASLSLDDLRRFYRHPVRAFFQQRLQVYFSLEETELADEEPFSLNSLQRYQLNTDLLNQLVNQQPIDRQFTRLRASGALPYGAFGEWFWQQQQQDMQELAERVIAEKQTVDNLEFSLSLGSVTLFGWLNQAQSDGVLRWRAAELSIVDGLTLWLDHLVYCLLGGSGESRMYGRKNSEWRFVALTPADAEQQLLNLIDGLQVGMNRPLLLLPKTCWAWLNSCFDQQSGQIDWSEEAQHKARQQLIKIWQGDKHLAGEGEDPYCMRLFRVLEEQTLTQLMAEAQRYLLPLAQHQQK